MTASVVVFGSLVGYALSRLHFRGREMVFNLLWPLMVIREPPLMTMPLMVTLFAVGGQAEARLGVQLAAAMLLALPVIVAYVFLQRYLIESIASSGMKS